IVRVPPGRAGGQVDHIVGRAALRVVETVVLDGDANGPRLEIMAAAALFEPAVRHRHLAIDAGIRSEEHTSELQSLMRISYAVFCLKKKKKNKLIHHHTI